MKRLIFAILVAPLFFGACADKESSSAAAPIAPTAACMNGTTYCDASLYAYNQGFSAYPQNPYSNPASGNFCNCPAGQRPVYNGQYGLGCMSNTAFQPYAANAAYWSWSADNNQWVNEQITSNAQGYYGNSTMCYQGVAQTCLVDQPNSCGAGLTCRVTGAASRVGVCSTTAITPGSAQAASSMYSPGAAPNNGSYGTVLYR
jgi:hypothetical protein